MAQLHYTWYDDIFSNVQVDMKKLYLENNESITLTSNHFVYVHGGGMLTMSSSSININGNVYQNENEFEVMRAQDVSVGDYLFYHDTKLRLNVQLVKITDIENVQAEKRVIFTRKPFVLINDVIASPYIGPHAMYHYIFHFVFETMVNLLYQQVNYNQLFVSIVSALLVLVSFAIHYGVQILCAMTCVQLVCRRARNIK